MDRLHLHQSSYRSRSVNPLLKPKRLALFGLLIIVLAGIGVVGWLGYRAAATFDKISAASDQNNGFLDLLGSQSDTLLKGERSGRINVVLLGNGGSGHPGGQLTDTMMVASFLPKEGKIGLISVPRDLYVPIAGGGHAKINSAFAYGEQREEGTGAVVAMETLSDVLGISIDYYIGVDFDGFVELVDALGGVDIDVEQDLYDPFYPDEQLIGYAPFSLEAGPTHMNGELALKYARSRQTTSDFDRSRRQQNILAALRDKGLSLGVLANPKKISDILSIAGNHVRTNLSFKEMRRFLDLAQGSNLDEATTIVLDTSNDGPLTSQSGEQTGYIIVPRKGLGNFSAVQTLVRTMFDAPTEEAVTIEIRNGTGVSSVGGNIVLLLRSYGYQHVTLKSSSASKTTYLLVKTEDQYQETRAFLEDRFQGLEETAQVTVDENINPDIVLVLGTDYLAQAPSTNL